MRYEPEFKKSPSHLLKKFAAYVQVFSALIVIIAGAFVITIIYRVVQESRREKGVATETSLSSKSIEKVEASSSHEKTASKATTAGTSQKSGGTETGEATVTITDDEEDED
ncbi:testis-expressed protein 29 [Pteropus vampyrus]|uniref:Testis-expressed protein 29 n=1 Tax=Pteropus vampyrus TaxID=132908 RepID=A0A6P3QXU5_PTEVA|nr:testis-expressed protein 29 [Pteropus vampyrus]